MSDFNFSNKQHLLAAQHALRQGYLKDSLELRRGHLDESLHLNEERIVVPEITDEEFARLLGHGVNTLAKTEVETVSLVD